MLPGLVHHVWTRALDGRDLFLDVDDRRDVVARLSAVLPDGGARCFGWALMSNHVHLVVKTGHRRLGTLMQRVFTGYAMRFNGRSGRRGYLLQGRPFESVPETLALFGSDEASARSRLRVWLERPEPCVSGASPLDALVRSVCAELAVAEPDLRGAAGPGSPAERGRWSANARSVSSASASWMWPVRSGSATPPSAKPCGAPVSEE